MRVLAEADRAVARAELRGRLVEDDDLAVAACRTGSRTRSSGSRSRSRAAARRSSGRRRRARRVASRHACASRSFLATPFPPLACSRSSAFRCCITARCAASLNPSSAISPSLSEWTPLVRAPSCTGTQAGGSAPGQDGSDVAPRVRSRSKREASSLPGTAVYATIRRSVPAAVKTSAVEGDVPDRRVHERLRLRAVLHDRRVGPQLAERRADAPQLVDQHRRVLGVADQCAAEVGHQRALEPHLVVTSPADSDPGPGELLDDEVPPGRSRRAAPTRRRSRGPRPGGAVDADRDVGQPGEQPLHAAPLGGHRPAVGAATSRVRLVALDGAAQHARQGRRQGPAPRAARRGPARAGRGSRPTGRPAARPPRAEAAAGKPTASGCSRRRAGGRREVAAASRARSPDQCARAEGGLG